MDMLPTLKTPINPIIIGKIRSTYGIYGWLKIFSYTEIKKNIFNYQPWIICIEGTWKSIYLETWKYHKKNLVIKIQNIQNRNKAHLLTQCKIVITSKQLPHLTKDFYWTDLIHCKVITIKGIFLGKVINMIETGSNDVMIVRSHMQNKNSIKEYLVPFLDKKVIKKINLITQIILVDWNVNF
ncbi:Ribosome maturation factor RimM [Candidatus Ecksteinia adelgidicola]|nr:Ribosome maturation factor RimM [Candidatus Ecksteinia adelgidicola]